MTRAFIENGKFRDRKMELIPTGNQRTLRGLQRFGDALEWLKGTKCSIFFPSRILGTRRKATDNK